MKKIKDLFANKRLAILSAIALLTILAGGGVLAFTQNGAFKSFADEVIKTGSKIATVATDAVGITDGVGTRSVYAMKLKVHHLPAATRQWTPIGSGRIVNIIHIDNYNYRYSQTTDSNSEALYNGIASGSYTVEVPSCGTNTVQGGPWPSSSSIAGTINIYVNGDCGGGGGGGDVDPTEETFTIQGNLFGNVTGTPPIANGTVMLKDNSDVSDETDSAGYYKIENVPFEGKESHVFEFSANGYVTKELPISSLVSAQQLADLQPGQTITKDRTYLEAPSYQVIGYVYLTDSTQFLEGVKAEVIDTSDSNKVIATGTSTATAAATWHTNYTTTPTFKRIATNGLNIRLTKTGYELAEYSLSTNGVINATTPASDGTQVITLSPIYLRPVPVNVSISGKVTKSENGLSMGGVALELKDVESGTITNTTSDLNGNYAFRNLTGSKKYRVTARVQNRTTQSKEVMAIDGQDTRVIFSLEANSDFQAGGYVQGHVYLSNQNNSPAKNMRVILYRFQGDKKVFFKDAKTDDTGFYKITVSPEELFVNEGGTGATVGADCKLSVQVGVFWPIFKNSYDFTVHWREGFAYEQDIYMAYDVPQTASKAVTVTVYQEVVDRVKGTVISSTKASSVPVRIIQEEDGEPQIASDYKNTNTSGIAVFRPVERSPLKVEVGKLPDFYMVNLNKSVTSVTASGTTAKIYIYRYRYPTADVMRTNLDKYYYSQKNSNWSDDKGIFDQPADRTIGKVGCCLTSVAMAMNRYVPGITPETIGDYFRAHGYNANISSAESWQNAVKDLSGDKLTIEIQRSGTWSYINSTYLNKGMPVVVHSYSWPGHSSDYGHCTYVVSGTNGVSTYLDPAPINGARVASAAQSRAGINFYIIIRPKRPLTISAAAPESPLAIVDSAQAASTSITSGSEFGVAATINNPNNFNIADVYVEKKVGTKVYKYRLVKGKDGKYWGTIPGYTNTASFTYRFIAIEGLGIVNTSSYKSVTVTGTASVTTRAVNTVERASAAVTTTIGDTVKRWYNSIFSKE